jgi:phosphoglycolate phosphatase
VLISEGFAPSLTTSSARPPHGALGLLRAGLGDELLEELGATRLRTALLDYYAANLCVGTRPYEGMVDLIEWLDEKKLPWGIVTNKPGFLTEPLLAALPELASCGVTVSADTLPVRKPDPAPMFFACERLGIAASQCLYVGITCATSRLAAMPACVPRSPAGVISMMTRIRPLGRRSAL